jgi:anaphase-promoting complex subunit 10
MGSLQEYLRAYFIQIAVLSNHQNGRDTHIRQIRIYGPHVDLARAMGHPLQYSTTEFQMFSCVR